MSKVKVIVLVGVVLLLGLVIAACVPGSVQQAISQTSADLQGLKGDVKKLGDKVDALSKVVQEPEITQAERDIKEHVVRGRADFIGFQEEYTKFSKTMSKLPTQLFGTPAKIDKQTGKVTAPAKPGPITNIDKKLDALVGIPAKPAVPEKKDPVTDQVIAKAQKAVPAKPGLLDKVNDRLDALLGIPGKPGKAAIPEKKDPQTGKVITKAVKAVPAVPPKPGLIDDVKKDVGDIKARLERIESKLGIVAPAAPAPAAPAAPAPAQAAP